MKRAFVLFGAVLTGCNPFPSFDGFSGCPSSALFCDDFERSDAQGAWTSEDVSGGGSLAIASGTPTGRALRCDVPAGASGAAAALVDVTSESPQVVTMRSLVNLSAAPTQGGIHLNNLAFHGASGDSSSIFPYFSSYGLFIGELRCSSLSSCMYQQSAAAPLPSTGAWHEVAITVDFSESPAHLTLEIDGAAAIDEPSKSGAAAGALEFDACAAAVDPSHGDVEVMVDEVAVFSP